MVSVSLHDIRIEEVEVDRFITINDVIDAISQYTERSEVLPDNHLMIINATNCRTNIGLKDLTKLDKVNRVLARKFNLLKVAVLVNDPMYTAICMVYQQLIKSNHYYFQVFSTRGAAQRWLLRK